MQFDDAYNYFCWPRSVYPGTHFRILYSVKVFHQIKSAAWVCTSEMAISEQKQLLYCVWKEQWMGCWNICWIKLWLFQWIPCGSGMWMWQTLRFCKKEKKKKERERKQLWIWKNSLFIVKTVKTGMKNQLLPGDMDSIWKTDWRDSWFQPLKDDLGSWSRPALDCVGARCLCLELPLSIIQEKSNFLLFPKQHMYKNGHLLLWSSPQQIHLVIQLCSSYLTVWKSLLKGISVCSKPPSSSLICHWRNSKAAEAPQLRFH